MGFEPTASTLQMSGSRRVDQGLSEEFPGGGVSIPSGSLTIPLLPSRQRHVKTRLNGGLGGWRRTGTHIRSAGLSGCATNGARSPLATITFLSERADITGPQPGVLVAEQTRVERHQRDSIRTHVGVHSRNVTHRASLMILPTGAEIALYTDDRPVDSPGSDPSEGVRVGAERSGAFGLTNYCRSRGRGSDRVKPSY